MVESSPRETEKPPRKVSRRDFLKYSAGAAAVAAGATTLLGSIPSLSPQPRIPTSPWSPFLAGSSSSIEEITISQIQAMYKAGTLTVSSLVKMYTSRISALDQSGPKLNSIIQLNPDAATIASQLDSQLAAGQSQGILFGIPVVLKDNIDTRDKMQTAAGSLALVGSPALQDSTVAANLRNAGAVILGKTTLSEWANF
ncbi:MAG TPA: amidase family protein, partial [Candidatus Bathyarchaeia archaeon]|nr:amidase family protein [Candidatus Bathyarchaeia archaeon]